MRVSVGLKQRDKLLKQTETYKEQKGRTNAWLVSLRLPMLQNPWLETFSKK